MKTIIISLGGSIIVPDEIDAKFLKDFKKLIEDFIKKGHRFVLYCGGGSTARKYQKALSEITDNNEALDWMGIASTYLNAFLLKAVFYNFAEPEIIEDPTKKLNFNKKMLIACGWKPGWSTDYDAVLLAKNLKTDTVINLTNVDYVYNKNPKKHKDAKPITSITWKDFRLLVGDIWNPGLNMPFDPIASKEAEKSNIKVAILGKDLENLKKYLENKKFKGTVISN